MNEFGRNYPATNHWGNLGPAGKEYSLQVQAPGIEITGLDVSITEMCATMSAVLEDGASDSILLDTVEASQTPEQRQKATKYNETALYDTIQTQVDSAGSGLQLLKDDHIFDDHGELRFALAPMATAIVQTSSGEVTMIVGWRGSVRGAAHHIVGCGSGVRIRLRLARVWIRLRHERSLPPPRSLVTSSLAANPRRCTVESQEVTRLEAGGD